MSSAELEKLKYPAGKYISPEAISTADLNEWIGDIKAFPKALMQQVDTLTEAQLDWVYRPGGWNIRQVVHHCADSHLNSQMRFKLALTEDKPTIKPYEEAKWALLTDINSPVGWSLQLLDGLHKKWVFLLESLSENNLQKTYYHPEHKRHWRLDETIALYSWHCKHHLAHIKQAIKFRGKFS